MGCREGILLIHDCVYVLLPVCLSQDPFPYLLANVVVGWTIDPGGNVLASLSKLGIVKNVESSSVIL